MEKLSFAKNHSMKLLKHQLDSSNCVGICLLSDAHSCLHLSKSALVFIHRNFVDVSKNEELLASEELKIECEEQVFEAAMRWVLYDLPRGSKP